MPNVKNTLINAAWAAASRMENEAGQLERQARHLRECAQELLRELDPPADHTKKEDLT